MAKEEIEHKKRRYLIIILMALLVAFLAVVMAQNAQDTADINNVFAPFLNNTNLAPQFPGEPTGTGERVTGVTYWANDSPIWLMAFSHANTAAQTAGATLFINGTMVEPSSGKPLGAAEEANKSVVGIIPKGANYSVVFDNYHHYEWREYPILSGKNGTLNVTQIINTGGDFFPYIGANKNVTVGVNNFSIISMDGNSTIYLPNSSHGSIIIAQSNSTIGSTGVASIDGNVALSSLIGLTNSTYILSTTQHGFRVNNTEISHINKTGTQTTNLTITAHANLTGADPYIAFNPSSGLSRIYTTSDFHFNPDGNNKAYFNYNTNKPIVLGGECCGGSGGFTGIGMDDPLYRLDVYNGTDTYDVMRIRDTDGTCLLNPEAASLVITCSSDISLKENITVLDTNKQLYNLSRISIKEYDVKASGSHDVGVIAQEYEFLFPDKVKTIDIGNGRQVKGVVEPNVWELVATIQELNNKINYICSKNQTLCE